MKQFVERSLKKIASKKKMFVPNSSTKNYLLLINRDQHNGNSFKFTIFDNQMLCSRRPEQITV